MQVRDLPPLQWQSQGELQPQRSDVPINPRCQPSVPAGQHATLTDALDEMYRVPGSETVITAGVYRGKTYGHMLHRTDYSALNVKNKNKSKVFTEFRAWVERFHEIDHDGIIQIRDAALAIPVGLPSSSSNADRLPSGAKKKPPNPPKPQKCANARIRVPLDTRLGRRAVTADTAA